MAAEEHTATNLRIETGVGPCTLRKRGRFWYARIQRRGTRREICLETSDSVEAVLLAQERVPNALLGRHELILSGSGIPIESYYSQMFKNARGRAKQNGIKFSITSEQWGEIVSRACGKCEITGIVFSLAKSKKGFRAPFAPSIDRVNSDFGYEAGNVRLVCVAVNWALSDWGASVLDAIAFAYTAKRLGQFAGDAAGLRNRASL